MSDLLNIQSQIEKLQKQATEIKTKEFDKTVKEIRSKMQAFGITVKDLQLGKSSGKGGAKGKPGRKPAAANGAKKATRQPVAAKYRGPEGEIWTGRGLTPRWLTTLVAQGRTKEEFAIAGQ
jgi:DNA-binding protein H-NS